MPLDLRQSVARVAAGGIELAGQPDREGGVRGRHGRCSFDRTIGGDTHLSPRTKLALSAIVGVTVTREPKTKSRVSWKSSW